MGSEGGRSVMSTRVQPQPVLQQHQRDFSGERAMYTHEQLLGLLWGCHKHFPYASNKSEKFLS